MNYSYNRAHDDAQRQARRHALDLQWAKERRRQHDRDLARARRLLATKPLVLAQKTVLVAVLLLALVAAGLWLVEDAPIAGYWKDDLLWLGLTLTVGILIGALVSLLRIHSRREAAQKLVRAHPVKRVHTQYHIEQSTHSFVAARAEVFSTRG
ncbi:hypothetical protein [Diaminobutyricibacter sp. McL0608]|uniref:hypothetical protein n=1 Tax=Leifsonia sp. McL0608 TaxID=3143537 RepID=UPI0031F300FE